MKRMRYFILVIFVFSFALQSCLKDDKDVFDKSATERINDAIKVFYDELVSAEYGWVLEYYPKPDQSLGGFVYTLKFDKELATASVELDPTFSKTSYFKIIGDQGPVLSFDSYNSVLHFFANPSTSKPDALQGDYEFVILKQEGSIITLKGKKTGNKMRLIKLTEPAAQYMTKALASKSFFSGVPSIVLSVSGKDIVASKSATSISFSYTENGKDTTVSSAYISTPKGICLYKDLTINGQKFREFAYSSDNSSLVGIDNNNVIIRFIYPPINEAISNTGFAWTINVNGSGMSSNFANLWTAALTENTAQYGETVTNFTMGANRIYGTSYDKVNKFAFIIVSEGYSIVYGYNMTSVAGTSNEVNIALTQGTLNWSYYTWFGPFLTAIGANSPYKIVADDEKRPTILKFVSKADSNVWFILSK